jgi:hypothetical protein
VIAQRTLAIIAAIFLVGAVALATLGPPGVPLGQTLILIDHDLLHAIQAFVETHLARWFWGYLLVPLLLRPAWLLPAAIGIICAGLSITLASRHAASNQHRRRS